MSETGRRIDSTSGRVMDFHDLDFDPVVWRSKDLAAPESEFRDRGFVLVDQLINQDYAAELCRRLDVVLDSEDGSGDVGKPDKVPALTQGQRGATAASAHNKNPRGKNSKSDGVPQRHPHVTTLPSKRTLQVINIWKADTAFRSLVLSPSLGQAVADLAGWSSGARVINDQVWAKPPGSSALTFHRDSAYFDLVPNDIATVWVALDDMRNPSVGPLQYVQKSHLWNDHHSGGTEGFFQKNNHRWMCIQAYKRHLGSFSFKDACENNYDFNDTEEFLKSQTISVSVPVGGAGIHDGRLWHGSDRNQTQGPRRGLGIHFAPAEAAFRDYAGGKTLAHKIANQADKLHSPDLARELFPITFTR